MNTSYEIKGFSFSATSARVKSPNLERLDFALVKADAPAVTAGVTTTNLVYAAPVEITRGTPYRRILPSDLAQFRQCKRGYRVNAGNAMPWLS